MSDDPITYRGTVYPWHCDHMGHMNVMWYVGKFDEAIWNMFARLGLTPSYLRGARLGMAAVEQTIRYQRELVAGDVVEVRSFVTAVSEKSITFRQTLSHADGGEVAATMEVVGVHLDTVERKSVRLPPSIAARARQLLTTAPQGAVQR